MELQNNKINNDKLNQILMENKILKSNLQAIEKQYQDQLMKFNSLSNQYVTQKEKSEEYKTQLEGFQKTIEILRFESKEQLLKNAELEERLKKYKDQEKELEDRINMNKSNEQKMNELTILLKESRRQNIDYSNQIKELKKDESTVQQMKEEITYLQQENMTLKAYIVSQNKMSHYGNAFKNFNFEQFCPMCSNSKMELCQRHYLEAFTAKIPEKEALVPEKIGNNRLNYVTDKEASQKKLKDFNQTNESLPKINKQRIKQLMDKCDLSTEAIEAAVKTIFHLGDQVEIVVDSDLGKICTKATVKYMGNLDDRYHNSFFLGVKMHQIDSERSINYCNGSFRKKRFFNIDSLNGYFLHFSNVICIYNKETCQFEDLDSILCRTINPIINKRLK